MTTTKQMIVNAFTKAFNKHFYNELVIGKLAHSGNERPHQQR